jgi:hypothetical protein
MVSNITSIVDATKTSVNWVENGTSSQWDVEFGLHGFAQGHGTLVQVADNPEIEIDTLLRPCFYDFYVRPTCSTQWMKHSVYVATYWHDAVSEQPDGYSVNENDVVVISSAEGLAYWSKIAQTGDWYRDVVLDSDIDLDGKLWKPVPSYAGSIDGQGHVIRNMKIYEPSDGGAFIIGFSGMVIKNLGLEDYDIRGYQCLAGLVINCSGDVLNCYAKNGYFEGDEIGGLIDNTNRRVQNCYSFDIYTKGGGYTSGLVRVSYDGIIQNCYSFVHSVEGAWSLCAGVLAISFGSDVDHCYSGRITANSNGNYAVSSVQSASYVSDTSMIIKTNEHLLLNTPVRIDMAFYDDLLEALNQFVVSYGDNTWKKWKMVEGCDYPAFDDYNTNNCVPVTGISVKNEIINEQYCIKLTWDDIETDYEVICHSADTVNKAPIMYSTTDTCLVINDLNMGETYRFRVRSVCNSEERSRWSDAMVHVFDKPYWHEYVISQPSGFDINGNVITISSVEGFVWLARGLNGMEPEALEIGFGSGYEVNLVTDIDLGAYKWMPISQFSGELNGQNHSIRNIYSQGGLMQELNNAVIRDLYVDGMVKKSSCVGGLCDRAFSSTVINCHSAVNVFSIDGYAGSLGGDVISTSLINCSSSGTVIGDGDCGGLIGFTTNCDVINCYSSSLVRVYDDSHYTYWRGGLLGYVRDTRVENSYACGSVEYAGWQSFAATLGYAENNSSVYYTYGLNNPLLSWYSVFFMSFFDEYPEAQFNNYSLFNNNGSLYNAVTIDDVNYSDLLSALNAWVDANDTNGAYLHWVADTENVNGGFPVFATPTYQIAVGINSAEGGSAYGSGTYEQGSTCTLTAAANSESHSFLNWTESDQVVSTANPYSFTVNEDRDLTANFIEKHFETDYHQFPDNMGITGVVYIDNVEQTSPLLELGAFCGNEPRGSEIPTHVDIEDPSINRWMYFLVMPGESGDNLTFKLYDHSTQQELDVQCVTVLEWDEEAGYAYDFNTPLEIRFTSAVTQATTMVQGWNWWSTYIVQEGTSGML